MLSKISTDLLARVVNCRSECVASRNFTQISRCDSWRRRIVAFRFDLSSAAFLSGAPHKNHRWETRHLVGPIQGVGGAGHRESVSAALRRCGLREP